MYISFIYIHHNAEHSRLMAQRELPNTIYFAGKKT